MQISYTFSFHALDDLLMTRKYNVVRVPGLGSVER